MSQVQAKEVDFNLHTLGWKSFGVNPNLVEN